MLVLILALIAAVYLLFAYLYPYAVCSACKGRKNYSPSGKYWNECGRCTGSGKQLRLAARLLGRDQ